LTGDLNAKIFSSPSFPGLEKHYLKAILVRITFGTQIVPKDYFKLNEDNRKLFILYYIMQMIN
jgi:radial spoke head protein 4A